MNEDSELITTEEIQNLIYNVRGKQVMLDSDVANLYHTETRAINQALKRNIDRFPEDFCFQLTDEEFLNLRSQTVIFKSISNKGKVTRKYNPFVFTEQGIIMLSGILRTEIAVKVSIKIVEAFVRMRHFLKENGQIFERITTLEYQQIENQRIFFNGQIYDAYNLIIDIIKKADNKITIIDNYVDDSILEMLTKKKDNVEVVILTSNKSNIKNIDIQKFNQQYPTLKVATTNKFHDRFIILDEKEMYHLGASIKDLGKKCFGINKIENEEMIDVILNVCPMGTCSCGSFLTHRNYSV